MCGNMSSETIQPTAPAPARTTQRPVVSFVVQQHAEESAMLRHVRSVLVRAPHVGLLHLGRLDERISAHLDGLAVAGRHGDALLLAALERPGAGEVFALCVRALQSRNTGLMNHVLDLADVLPDAARGIASALGWVSSGDLQGVVRQLLVAPQPARRALGLTACRLHQVDPGPVVETAFSHPDAMVRVAALRVAGALGRLDLLDRVRQAITDDSPDVVREAATAACLLGDRRVALQVLGVAAQRTGEAADLALALLLAALDFGLAGDWVRGLSRTAQSTPADAARQRRLIRAFGWLGDARFVPWLIERMVDPVSTRLAGEAFCWITGADLARMDLETLDAPALTERPDVDPSSDDVSIDEDDSLPWPDVVKVQAWWSRQTTMQATAAAGQRLFEGEPPSPELVRRVLVDGTQRRRAQAARWACVLQPGARLFPVAAPTWRQRRWLDQPARS